jgi:hypothetical protein
MMTLGRFRALAESYGAALPRWPAELRGEAEALLRASAAARALLAEARTVDETIAAAGRREDAALWPPGAREAALARLRSGVAARIGPSPPRWPMGRLAGWAPSSAALGWVGLAAGGGLAVAAGLVIGAMSAAGPAPDAVLAILQASPIHVLAN